MQLSVVTTLYRSSPFVAEFYTRMTAAVRSLTDDYELIFVDDGSPDDAAERVHKLGLEDPRVVLVELSRNFGHHPAAVAGLATARGDRVFIIDIDLEEQPEWLGDFWADLEDHPDADVIFGTQPARQGSWLSRYGGGLFWWLFAQLSQVPVPANPCTIRLMTRRYVDALLRLPERTLFLAGTYAWTGFHQISRDVTKRKRPGTSYSPIRMLKLFVDAITSFSAYPLQLVFWIGLVVSGVAMLGGLVIIAWKLLGHAIDLGWPSLIVSVWLLGGIQIMVLGLVGIYVSRVFTEVKQRPLYVIKDIHRLHSSPS